MERNRVLLCFSRRGFCRARNFLVLPTLAREGKDNRVDNVLESRGLTHSMGIAGAHALLPLGQKIVDKITRIIDAELTSIGAQKMSVPSMCSKQPWEATGRWNKYGAALFRLRDRAGNQLCLGPTHEESFVECIAAISPNELTPKLPLKLYQTGWKYRDEPRPKQGLLRAREFLMNDMYSFHSSKQDCENTYEEVTEAYKKIFTRIGVPFLRANAHSGDMGGALSHEYHCELPLGEDRLAECSRCQEYFNRDTLVRVGDFSRDNTAKDDAGDDSDLLSEFLSCPRCTGSLGPLRSCVEIGHTFVLGDLYTRALGANCLVDNKKTPVEMGCYGIGVTRLLAAAVLLSSSSSSTTPSSRPLPVSIAPFTVAVVGPKQGAKDFDEHTAIAEEVAAHLHKEILPNDRVILDDRKWTIGRRLLEQRQCGTPYAVVVGKNGQLELNDLGVASPDTHSTQGASDSNACSETEPPFRIMADKSEVYDFFIKLRRRYDLL